jgi:hypothetical protein
MPASSALRIQIERALEHHFPAALTPAPRTIREVAPTGIAAVDAILDGGLPIGAISELTGPESSGRTSLVLAFVAKCIGTDQVCAWVDATDALDPESAAASGVDLRRLLWVRCSGITRNARPAPLSRLDQAMRAADLLLQVGGFATIVLDLGSTAPEHGVRIPLATWFRFRQAADRARCCLLVLSQSVYAQSSAAAVLECSPLRAVTTDETVLHGFEFETQLRRERCMTISHGARKPPASTWSANAAWAPARHA